MKENYSKGEEILKKIAGPNGQEAAHSFKEIFDDFDQIQVGFGFGQIYSRENLDLKTREIVTVTSLISQGAFDQLGFHMKAALNVGVSKEELLEVILHCALYVGFPKSCSALAIAQEVLSLEDTMD